MKLFQNAVFILGIYQLFQLFNLALAYYNSL